MTASAESIESLEFERKFLIRRSRLEAAHTCLNALCRPDARYGKSLISSLYYDTPGFRLAGEKEDSTLYKTKVRLRWYEDAEGRPDESCFLEVKSRIGLRRAKRRIRLDLDTDWLSQAPLTDRALLEPLRALDEDPTVALHGLRPVLVVRYSRRRWDDPLTGARVSLDRGISVPRVNPHLLAHARAVHLPVVILELKNRDGRLPPNLRLLRSLEAEACSFSKYYECLQAMASSETRVA